jgi:hypothetical protein
MKHLLIIPLLLLIFSCSNNEDNFVDSFDEEANIDIQEVTTESIVEESTTDWMVLYEYVHWNFDKYNYFVNYYIHTNDMHPNGYVIITKFRVEVDLRPVSLTGNLTYTPNLIGNEYIEAIHNKENFAFETEEGDIYLAGMGDASATMFERFATAQAIANAHIHGDTSIDNVARIGRAMEGRQYGVAR